MRLSSRLFAIACLVAALGAAVRAAEPQLSAPRSQSPRPFRSALSPSFVQSPSQNVRAGTLREAFPNVFGPASSKPPQLPWFLPAPIPAQSTAISTVVCGMTVVRGDSSIDPKILKPVPDTGVTPTMRVIEPTMCRAEEAVKAAPQPTTRYFPLRGRK
jgi:hypothetical protein